jgi:hypothetical protein
MRPHQKGDSEVVLCVDLLNGVVIVGRSKQMAKDEFRYIDSVHAVYDHRNA